MPLLDLTTLIGSLALTIGVIQTPLVASRKAGPVPRIGFYMLAGALAVLTYQLGRWLESGGWESAGQGVWGGALLTGCLLAVTPFSAAGDFLSKRLRRGGRSVQPEGGRSNERAARPLPPPSRAVFWTICLLPFAALLFATLSVSAGSLIWEAVWATITLWQAATGIHVPGIVRSALIVMSFAAGLACVAHIAANDYRRRLVDLRCEAGIFSTGRVNPVALLSGALGVLAFLAWLGGNRFKVL